MCQAGGSLDDKYEYRILLIRIFVYKNYTDFSFDPGYPRHVI